MRYLFEIFPVILAIISIYACTRRYQEARRHTDKITFILAIVASSLLILAQFTWMWQYFIQGDLMGTWIANTIWTIFNATVMVCFIYMAVNRRY